MSLAAGALSIVSVGPNSDVLSSAVATGGTAPYSYQWYRSTATGFSPGPSNILAGATSLSLSDSGLVPGTIYYYKVVATDSASPAATATSAQLVVTTSTLQPNPNQFALSPYLGMLDLRFNGDTLACVFDPAGSGSLVGGQAVKFSVNAAGMPLVVPSLAQADVVAGYVNYDIKSAVFGPGNRLEISMAGNVMYLMAAASISRGQSLIQIPAAVAGGTNGGVLPVTGSSGFPIVGFALDTVAIGSLVRVFLQTPPAPYAID